MFTRKPVSPLATPGSVINGSSHISSESAVAALGFNSIKLGIVWLVSLEAVLMSGQVENEDRLATEATPYASDFINTHVRISCSSPQQVLRVSRAIMM